MTGMAAIAFCAAFTSCSKEITPMSEEEMVAVGVQKIYSDYEAAFQRTFGTPAPGHTWGFSDAAGTRGVFANGNEWAANDRTDCMYRVPPKLSDDQIKIVRIYFQSVKDPDFESPGWTDYFIQQVYKGGSNPGPNSTEKYKAADGNTDIVGSDHMDHLAAINGTFVDHNNNFNHGDCGVYGNVLNFKGTLTTVEETYPVNSGNEYRHADKINLMTNSTTASFGYYNSNSSIRRTEYTGLVSWSTIKTWADQHGHTGEADCLNDGWNRSFMGFDFEMLVDEDVYSYTMYDAAGNVVYWGEYDHKVPNYFSVELPNGNEEVWNGTTYVSASTVGEVVTDQWGNKKLYPYFPGTTEKVGLLSSNANQYAGTPDQTWNGTDWERYEGSTKHLSVEKMISALRANKLPKNQYEWVIIGGTADHYYSDWIVTLTEAKKYTTTPPPPSGADLRVMAEDLSANDEGKDFDFNDVVFDVYFSETLGEAYVMVQAAGGTLPLKVHGTEVHGLFDKSTDTMINTHAENQGLKGASGLAPQKIQLTGITVNSKSDVNKLVKIMVQKDVVKADGQTVKEWVELVNSGAAACKIGVDPNTRIANEREDVNSVVHFNQWVTEGGQLEPTK